MANLRAPGLSITERDVSDVLVPAGTSVGALVGAAYQGPTNQRILITNDKDLIQTFGAPKTGSSSEFAYYAALEFLKESGFLWFTRATTSADVVGTVTFTTGGISSATSAAEKSSTQLFAVTGYEDGNTPIKYETIETESEPLVVGTLGPGSHSADIALTIVTSSEATTTSGEGYDYGYNWVGKYPTIHPIYRINVYVKDSQDTAEEAGWNTDPVKNLTPAESFIVSNNSEAKDFELNSLYVKDVINGNSNLIYVNTNGSHLTSGTTSSGCVFGAGSADLAAADIVGAWDLYKTKESIDINLALAPYTVAAQSDAAAQVANERRDCMAICQLEAEDYTKADSVLSPSKQTSYVASYVGGEYVYDKYTKKNIVLPNAIFAAKAYAFTDNVANVWNAPAGLSRGAISGLDAYKAFSEQEIGFMYNKGINSAKTIRGSGQYIWGQKTGQVKSTALNRVNVRRLLLYIENSVGPLLLGYLFEQNTDSTRSRVVSNINAFLATIFAGGGLYAFDTICDLTNNTNQVIDNNELMVDIFVQPSKTIEFINLRVTITRTGVDFAEIA